MTSDVYRPIDLAAYCNAGSELLGPGQTPVLGQQQLRGLPFLIGQAPKAFVALGPDISEEPMRIALDASACTVVIAHRLLGSNLQRGGQVGELVAEYVFRLADGTELRVPIRERFEIADLVEFGQLPFLAVPDTQHSVQPRWAGPWGQAGV